MTLPALSGDNMYIQLGFAALFTLMSWAIIYFALKIVGVFIAALLGSTPNEIDNLYTDLGKSSSNRGSKESLK